MIGLLWNIRGLGKIDRIPTLRSRIRDHHVDFVGIMETKKNSITDGLLRSLTWNVPFNWFHLEAKGTAGGILVGSNSDLFNMIVGDVLNFSISTLLTCKRTGFSWKFIVVYGPVYDEQRQVFLNELDYVMSSWQGPLLIGGDFNLVRFLSNKSNSIIDHRWADGFNNWIDRWGLIELNASNRKFTWINN
jgi:mannosylglycoprotein endo-beta-mannosidase